MIFRPRTLADSIQIIQWFDWGFSVEEVLSLMKDHTWPSASYVIYEREHCCGCHREIDLYDWCSTCLHPIERDTWRPSTFWKRNK